MTSQSTSLRIADSIARAPFAFPGGYRRWALLADGDPLCAACCYGEREHVATASPGDGWLIVGEFVHWEGAPLACSNCDAEHPSEYGEGAIR